MQNDFDQRRQLQRGDIYYVEIPYHTGHEIYKDRPGIIVSTPSTQRSNLVVVVFLSASAAPDYENRVTIRSAPEVCTAVVDQLYTVDMSRVGKFLGACTDREMQQIDMALASVLGIGLFEGSATMKEDLIRVTAERDVYRELLRTAKEEETNGKV